jgi:aconitate decarboxylase
VTYTRTLGDYVAASREEALPADLVDLMRLVVLDTVGCGMLGATLPWTRTVSDAVSATQPPGSAVVWGTRHRLGAADAVLINGTSVHAAEMDDVGAGGHHGSTTLTVAVALAESGHALSGTDAIRAMVAGIEVAARVAECLGHEPQVSCGFHLPGIVGAFAAAATASFVLGLDGGQTSHALGTAAQLAGGLMGTQHGGMGKRLAAGSAAHAGLRAAQLAAAGFTSSPAIFECGYGSFPEAFSGGRRTYDLTRLDDGLGITYRAYGVAIKRWACRLPIHGALEAIDQLRRTDPFDATDMVSMRVALTAAAFQAVGFNYLPDTAANAQLNLRYCVGVLLLHGDVSLDQFADDLLAHPDVLALVDRIEVTHDPALDGAGGGFLAETVVHVSLSDGRALTASGRARSHEHGPITDTEVAAKFDVSTRAVLGARRRGRIVEACASFDEITDVGEFARLLEGEPVEPSIHVGDRRHSATLTG